MPLSIADMAKVLDSYYQSPEAREWARASLEPNAPPGFDTQERSQIAASIAADEALFKQVTVRLLQAKALWSPTRLLPPEILARIFKFVAEDVPATFTFRPGGSCKHTILYVCKQWRQVAFNYAELWSKIDLTTGATHPPGAEIVGKKLVKWLERTKQAPLSISFDNHYIPGVAVEAWTVLTARRPKWRSLHGTSNAVIQSLFKKGSPPIPNLATLEFVRRSTYIEAETAPDRRQTIHPEELLPKSRIVPLAEFDVLWFPQLKTLVLDGLFLYVLQLVQAPQLTSLCINCSDIYVEHLVHISRQFPALRTLKLDHCTARLHRPGVPVPENSCRFQCLESCEWNARNWHPNEIPKPSFDMEILGQSPLLTELRLSANIPYIINLGDTDIGSVRNLTLDFGGWSRGPQAIPCWRLLQRLPLLLRLEINGTQKAYAHVKPVIESLLIPQKVFPEQIGYPLPLCPGLSELKIVFGQFGKNDASLRELSRDRTWSDDPAWIGANIVTENYEPWMPNLAITIDSSSPLPAMSAARFSKINAVFQRCVKFYSLVIFMNPLIVFGRWGYLADPVTRPLPLGHPNYKASEVLNPALYQAHHPPQPPALNGHGLLPQDAQFLFNFHEQEFEWLGDSDDDIDSDIDDDDFVANFPPAFLEPFDE